MGGKLGKSEKSSQAGEGFVEFLQGCGGALKSQMGPKRTPMALFRVSVCWEIVFIGSQAGVLVLIIVSIKG